MRWLLWFEPVWIGGRAANRGDALPEGSEIAGYRIEAMVARDAVLTDYADCGLGEAGRVIVRELFPSFVYRTPSGEVRCQDAALNESLDFARHRLIVEGRALGAIEAAALPHEFALQDINRTTYCVLEPSAGQRPGSRLEEVGQVDADLIERDIRRGLAAAIKDGLRLLVEDRPQSVAEWRAAFPTIA